MGSIISLLNNYSPKMNNETKTHNEIIKAISPLNYRMVVGFNFDKVTNQHLWDQRLIDFHNKLKRISIPQSFNGLRININDDSKFMIKLSVSELNLEKIDIFYHTIQQFVDIVSFYYEYKNELFLHAGQKYMIVYINDIQIPLRPNSFTQANHHMGNVLYEKINSLTKSNDTLICYGRNSFHIASQIHEKFKKIICINPCDIAYEDGYELMKRHVFAWFTFKSRESLYEQINSSNENATIIMSPGRSGYCYFDKINLDKLKGRQILYVTCNEETLKNDIKDNFIIKNNIMIELFPNTPYNEHIYELIRNI
jgi:tRNA/tmRNA/rRNA uracil-C5-methylase (TrmA/RlmC/RlmD family)